MDSASCSMRRRPVAAGIPGGFIRIRVGELLHAWRACLGRSGGAGDFRAWLAAHEIRVRRGAAANRAGRAASYPVAELANLCQVGDRRARDAVRRLTQAGLLRWDRGDGEGITFPSGPIAAGLDVAKVDESLPGVEGFLTIPRRLLRFLARGARPALAAVALGGLLRCVSRRRAGWGSCGRVKASWVAEVFGVDLRRVKAARAEWVALGWLEAEGDSADQVAWNRWGRVYRVELAWVPPVADCHPSGGQIGRKSSPPDLDPAPVPEQSNPEPARADRTPGVQVQSRGPILTKIPSPTLPRPTIRSISTADLASTARTLALHQAAVAQGWAAPSEASRLRFVAAAVHAQQVGTTNPPGLFRSIVANNRWQLLTQADEDRASDRLRAHAREQVGQPPSRPSRPSASRPAEPTSLAALLARFGGESGIARGWAGPGREA